MKRLEPTEIRLAELAQVTAGPGEFRAGWNLAHHPSDGFRYNLGFALASMFRWGYHGPGG